MKRNKLPILMALAAFAAASAPAKVHLPEVFADHMVLQRGAADPVWGTADPGEKVTVTFAGQTLSTVADENGKWMVKLAPLPPSAEARELVVSGNDSPVRLEDVLVGDVWLAGGQSNMGFPLNSALNAAETLAHAQDPLLRFYLVKTHTAAEPQSDGTGKWLLTTPAAARDFSAVAYFFAREIRRDQDCPVAVLQAPWGGTDIETWISLNGLKEMPPLTRTLDRWNAAVEQARKIQANPQLEADYERDLKQWQAEVAPAYDAALKRYNADKEAGKTVGPKPQPSRPEPTNPDPMGMPDPARRPSTPTVNFNGMIAPLVPFGIRGVIWYQGENNGSRGLEYRELFPRLIEDWREHWQPFAGKADNLPFLFVQLPCNGPDQTPVAAAGWPWLREAQRMALRLPNTGMAVTIDVGDPNNVHPKDKIDVGHRLALLARQQVYGEDIVASGPLYQSFTTEPDGKIRLQFSQVDGGLTPGRQPWCAPGVKPFPTDKLIGFFIAGADHQWVEAGAKIDGGSVVVSSPQVPQPVAVRYGWANSPRCNLYNQAGLPASPFRTDDWPN